MKYIAAVLVLMGLCAVPVMSHALTVGDTAPLFDAESTEGKISLQSYRGKKNVVLAFYFADFTPV